MRQAEVRFIFKCTIPLLECRQQECTLQNLPSLAGVLTLAAPPPLLALSLEAGRPSLKQACKLSNVMGNRL